MDTQLVSNNDVDIEEGELSDTSEEVYTPLQRPSLQENAITPTKRITDVTEYSKMESDAADDEDKIIKSISNIDDDDGCQSDDCSSSSGNLSDTCLDKGSKNKNSQRGKRHVKRTVMLRVHPTGDGAEQKKARFKKYDIWTAASQEDALTENMRGCDVTQRGLNDRNVENYDFSLRYRLSEENALKRRFSNSNDDLSDCEQNQPCNKRQRPCSRSDVKSTSSNRSAYERLGKRRDFRGRRCTTPSSSQFNSYNPKYIEDLDDLEGREETEIAKEMASKLNEEKDDLLVRIVNILGTKLPLEVYKETQRIESEGGMTIKNGQRRRTPGGVFFFLLKHHHSLSAEDQKAIFSEDRCIANKKQKDMKSIIRDQKVRELKKRLCEQDGELPNLSARKDLVMFGDETSQKQNSGNLSNPPPSPEAIEQNEFDLKSVAINHVTNESDLDVSDKPSTSRGGKDKTLEAYEDDFLDVNCGDMDFF